MQVEWPFLGVLFSGKRTAVWHLWSAWSILVQHTKPISDMNHIMKNGTYHHHTDNHCLLFLQDPESVGKNAKGILDNLSTIDQFAVDHPLIDTHASSGKGFLSQILRAAGTIYKYEIVFLRAIIHQGFYWEETDAPIFYLVPEAEASP